MLLSEQWVLVTGGARGLGVGCDRADLIVDGGLVKD